MVLLSLSIVIPSMLLLQTLQILTETSTKVPNAAGARLGLRITSG